MLSFRGCLWHCLLIFTAAQRGVESQGTTERASILLHNATGNAKKGTLASKVEHLVKEEFAMDVREAEEKIGATYNESANSGQVGPLTISRISFRLQ